jgi:hypothetical protein
LQHFNGRAIVFHNGHQVRRIYPGADKLLSRIECAQLIQHHPCDVCDSTEIAPAPPVIVMAREVLLSEIEVSNGHSY